MHLSKESIIGVIGAGTMGRGIAQVAATCGHIVKIYEVSEDARKSATAELRRVLNRLAEKGKLTQEEADGIYHRIHLIENMVELADCTLIIEAVVEEAKIKRLLFKELDAIVNPDAILATNTSSLSVTGIASACGDPGRVVGTHFFNPAPLMPLVEVVPAIATDQNIVDTTCALMEDWGKTTVLAKDTPGFIVNRVARPFYGEAIRMLEESVANVATIDWAMKEIGGFRMGPFELMDLIGNDVNLKVTETVWEAFFYDPRYKPSFTQKRMVEAGYLGRKSGRGYYEYGEDAKNPEPKKDRELGQKIFQRILFMLINEAADAVFWNVASAEDVDLAMTKGVNYPEGLLRWADNIGLEEILTELEMLQDEYGEDRYRPSPLLRRMVRKHETFYT